MSEKVKHPKVVCATASSKADYENVYRPPCGDSIPGRGVPFLAAFICSSIALSEEKMRVISCGVGGGMGYLPIANSTSDRPIDHMSD